MEVRIIRAENGYIMVFNSPGKPVNEQKTVVFHQWKDVVENAENILEVPENDSAFVQTIN